MKKLLLSIFIIVICFNSFGQAIINRSGAGNTVQDARLMAQYNMFIPRYNDTASANSGTNEGIDSCGALIYTRSPAAIWFRACTGYSNRIWIQILPSGGSSGSIAWLTEGNTFTDDVANKVFGSRTNNNILFKTRDLTRLVLDSLGIQRNGSGAFLPMIFDTTAKTWSYGSWQSPAGTGTVTSVGLSVPSIGSPFLGVSGTPVTTSGTLALAALGTSSQLVLGNGALGSSLPSALIPTWQQTLTAGSTLTGNNTITDGGNFTWNNAAGWAINSVDDISLRSADIGYSNVIGAYTGGVLMSTTVDGRSSEFIMLGDTTKFTPSLGNFKIDTLNNETSQNTLMGWVSTANTNRGKVGYITLGSGLSLASGVLSNSGVVSTPTWQQTLTAGSTLTGNNTVLLSGFDLEFQGNGSDAFNVIGVSSFGVNDAAGTRISINSTETGLFSTTSATRNSLIKLYTDSIVMKPSLGNFNIDTLNNETFQNQLMGWTSTSGANRGKVGYVTLGSGVSLSSGVLSATGSGGTVTSVGLTVPSPASPAFTVTGSPVTGSGTLAIGANGTTSQYIRGDGSLATYGTGLNYWGKNGDAGTVAGTNFLGTTDNVRLDLRANNTIWATILASGNVGLGTITPAYKLDVNGNVKITSTLTGDTSVTIGNTDFYGLDRIVFKPFTRTGVDTSNQSFRFVHSSHRFGAGNQSDETMQSGWNIMGDGFGGVIPENDRKPMIYNSMEQRYINTGVDNVEYGMSWKPANEAYSLYAGTGKRRLDWFYMNSITGASQNDINVGTINYRDTANYATVFGQISPSLVSFTPTINFGSLTVSRPVFTDGSKNLTSTGPGTTSQYIRGDGSLATYTGGIATASNGLTVASNNIKLGGTLIQNTSIDAAGYDFLLTDADEIQLASNTGSGFSSAFIAPANIILSSGVTSSSTINSSIVIHSDSITLRPYIGDLTIDTLNNETFQNTLMGWTSTAGANRGKVGYVTLGSGVSLSSGVLSATGSGGTVTGSGTTNYLSKWTPNGTTLGNSQIFDDGTNVGIGTVAPAGKFHVNNDVTGSDSSFVVMTSGNVGIGTAIPSYKFEVNSGATAEIVLLENTNTTAYNASSYQAINKLTLKGGNGTGATNLIRFAAGGSNEGYFGTVQNASGVAEFIWKNYNGSSYGELMRIAGNGNVGIGTAAPVAPLSVHTAQSMTSPTFILQNTSAASGEVNQIEFRAYDGRRLGGVQTTVVADWSSHLRFFTSTTQDAPTVKMSILNNGNVGIGTVAPLGKLQVAGDMSSNPATGAYGQIEAIGATSAAKRLSLGYNTTGNYGVIQAITNAISYDNLLLNPSGGNVGIGTTNPLAKLQVENAGVVGININDNSSTQIPVINFQQGGTTKGSIQGGVGLQSRLDFTFAGSRLLSMGSGGISGLSLGSTYVDINPPGNGMIIEGNVGIGTVAPLSNLHITGVARVGGEPTYRGNIIIDQTSVVEAGIGGLEFKTDGAVSGYGKRIMDVYDGSNNYNLHFQSRGNSAAWTSRMVMTNDGNVGIGTVAPLAKLDVADMIRTTAYTAVPASGAGVEIGYASTYGQINSYDRTGGAYTQLRIDGLTLALNSGSGGNVGIGTESPASKLHVYSAASTDILADAIKVSRPAVIGSYAYMSYKPGTNNAVFGSVYSGGGNGQLSLQVSDGATQIDALHINASGNVSIPTSASILTLGGGATASELRFLEPSAGGTSYIGFKAPALAGNTIYTHPNAYPAVTGHVLSSTDAGVQSWVAPSSVSWSLLGNSGTTAGTNFVGTTDAVDFVIATSGTERMRVLSGGNVGIGPAGSASSTAKLNIPVTTGAGTGFVAKFTSSTLSNGNILALQGTSPFLTAGNRALHIDVSGANNSSGVDATAANFSVTNTGTSSTNTALKLEASGATNNNALSIASGAISLNNDVGTTGQVLTSAGAGTVPTWTTPTVVSSGTYTPTRSAEVNTTGNAAPSEAQYLRVGNTVTVSGRFTVLPTLTATATSFEISLPIASNIGAVEDAAGAAFCGAIAGMGGEVTGSVANNTAVISWVSTDITSKSWSFTFTYSIL